MGRILTLEVVTQALRHASEIRTDQKLLAMRAEVHPHGDNVSFTMSLGSGLLSFVVGPSEISHMEHEVREARRILYDLAMMLGRGHSDLMRLALSAPRPTRVEVMIDWASGDRIFINHFEDRAPFAARLSPRAVQMCQAELARAEANKAH